MKLIETERLVIRHLTDDDAAFILELVNEPDFIRNIADRGVRTLDDARAYMKNGPMASYDQHGFGLFAVVLKETGEPIGMCGLLKRDYWDEIDIGYAILERYRLKGYAYEAASAVINYGHTVLNLPRIVAITAPDNEGSGRVLEKIGLRFDKLVRLPHSERDSKFFVPAEG